MLQAKRWCLACEAYTLHGKRALSSSTGCVLLLLCSILIVLCIPCLGLFLLVPLLPLFAVGLLAIAMLYNLLAPWRCQYCGTTGNPSAKPRVLSRPAIPRVHLPSIEWSLVWSRMRSLPSVVDDGIFDCWSLVEIAYAHLPDWAQPIVWALGLSAPVVIVAVGIWTVAHL